MKRKFTIFATNKQTKEKLVWCQTNDQALAKDILARALKLKNDLFKYELDDSFYVPKRKGVEGKDGRWS